MFWKKKLHIKHDKLVLGFYYEFHKEKIEDPKYRALTENKLKEYFKHSYKIECVIVEKSSEVEELVVKKESKHITDESNKPSKSSKITRLKHSKLMTNDNFPDGRVRLCMQFMDSEGNIYDWTPKWEDVNELFLKASTTEGYNKPDSAWLGQFAQTSREVFDRITGIKDAFVVKGLFTRIRDGKLVLLEQKVVHTYDQKSDDYVPNLQPGKVIGIFPVAFELTREWIFEHLQQWLECIAINNVIVKVNIDRPDSSEIE